MSNRNSYELQFDDYIHKLHRVIRKLKYLSTTIIVLLLLDVFSFAIDSIFSFTGVTGFFYSFYFVLTFSLLGIGYLYYFDQSKKQGEALYDVIGDVLEWLRSTRNDSEIIKSISKKIPPDDDGSPFIKETETKIMNIQFALRTFIRASDLPIVPGANGQATYLTIFIGLTVVNGMLKILSAPL